MASSVDNADPLVPRRVEVLAAHRVTQRRYQRVVVVIEDLESDETRAAAVSIPRLQVGGRLRSDFRHRTPCGRGIPGCRRWRDVHPFVGDHECLVGVTCGLIIVALCNTNARACRERHGQPGSLDAEHRDVGTASGDIKLVTGQGGLGRPDHVQVVHSGDDDVNPFCGQRRLPRCLKIAIGEACRGDGQWISVRQSPGQSRPASIAASAAHGRPGRHRGMPGQRSVRTIR